MHSIQVLKTIKPILIKIVFFIVMNSLVSSALADVYKCADKNGKVFYQNEPCGDGATELGKIRTDKTVPKRHTPTSDSSLDQSSQKSTASSTEKPVGNSILQKNLLSNPGFENNLARWSYKDDVKWQPGKGQFGSSALKIHARKPPDDKYIHETIVSQCVPIWNGVKFKLGGSFLYEGFPQKSHANRIRVIWYESKDCTKGGQFGSYAEPKNISGWQQLSRENITPALLAKAAKVEIKQNGRYTNNGKAYWDNVYLMATEISDEKPETPGYTLPVGFDFIENGHFNQDLSAWRTGWKSSWVSYPGDQNNGAAKIVAASDKSSRGAGALSQCVDFGAGGTFDVGASYKRGASSTQKGGARLRVTWYENAGCRGRAKTTNRHVDTDESMDWQRLRITKITSAPGSISAKIEIIQTVLGPGQHTAYWDDIYFKTVSAE